MILSAHQSKVVPKISLNLQFNVKKLLFWEFRILSLYAIEFSLLSDEISIYFLWQLVPFENRFVTERKNCQTQCGKMISTHDINQVRVLHQN